MKKTIAVIDGMGGGVGAQLISRLKLLAAEQAAAETREPEAGTVQPGTELEIIALGTNSAATERMIKAGADRGASGENAIRVSVPLGDIILGPMGIVIPDSLMGEITAAMAKAILQAPGKRILLPLQKSHFEIAGLGTSGLGKMIDSAMELVKEQIKKTD